MDSKDSQNPKECRLLKLPPELRLIIYEMVFADFQLNDKTCYRDKIKRPYLLHTCTAIREEALEIYLKRLPEILIEKREERDQVEVGSQLPAEISHLHRILIRLSLARDWTKYSKAIEEELEWWRARGGEPTA